MIDKTKKNKNLNVSTEHILYLKAQKKEKNKVLIGRIGLLVGLLLIWELSTLLNIADPFLTSSPSRIAQQFWILLTDGNLIKHSFITLYETIIAFTVSMLLGFVIAVLLFSSERTRKIIEPYLIIFNSLPKIALGPLLIVWVGAGTKVIILMGFLICIIITIVSLLNSFMSVSEEKIKLLQTMGATKYQILTKLVIPQSFPDIVSVLKINVGMSWVGTIMGEYLVSKAGLGYLIVYGGLIFKLDLVMTSIVVLCVLASLMYFLVAWLEKRVVKKRT